MLGVRFSFVATRSGLTRVRHNADDLTVKKEALAFAKRHARAADETFYSRTVDYNMLINDTATLIQVPFNTHQKIAALLRQFELESHLAAASAYEAANSLEPGAAGSSEGPSSPGMPRASSVSEMNLFEKLEILANKSLHVVATQSIIANEGAQRAVAGVAGVFYDYSVFVMRLLNATNADFAGPSAAQAAAKRRRKPAHCFLATAEAAADEACDESRAVRCGLANDTIDCLLVDNNGYIVASEQLAYIGRHLNAYDPIMMSRLVALGVYHELNVTDYQSICVRQEERQTASSASLAVGAWTQNLAAFLGHLWGLSLAFAGLFGELAAGAHQPPAGQLQQQQKAAAGQQQQAQSFQPLLALLPNKTYLRPCERLLTRYETRPGLFSADTPEYYSTACQCPAWFIYQQVPKTNLLMIVVDVASDCSAPPAGCELGAAGSAPLAQEQDDTLNARQNTPDTSEQSACSMFEREASLYKRKLDVCISHHPEENNIKLCGGCRARVQINNWLLAASLLLPLLLAPAYNSGRPEPLIRSPTRVRPN